VSALTVTRLVGVHHDATMKSIDNNGLRARWILTSEGLGMRWVVVDQLEAPKIVKLAEPAKRVA
jgi:hypothetical protein